MKNRRRLTLLNQAWRTPDEEAELGRLQAWVDAEVDRVKAGGVLPVEGDHPLVTEGKRP